MRPLQSHAAALAAALLCAACSAGPSAAPAGPSPRVDDVAAARAELREARARAARADDPAAVRRMVELGLWEEAEAALRRRPPRDAGGWAALAELRFRQHRYPEARAAVDAVLAQAPDHRAAALLRARLEVQAWRLEEAAAIGRRLLQARPRDADAALLLGRIRLLDKDYAEALEWARRAQRWDPRHAGAHLLEADVRFWNQDPEGAEPPLLRALALDPFDADARFAHGYAIWRRVDATQLDEMAAQWALALEVNPLHYVTHWHWGNGHTQLTYADYAQPSDSAVRARLSLADSLIAGRQLPAALRVATEVERDYPESVLPALLRGSAYYMAWDMDRTERLDSAEAAFREVLRRRPNYGPAHNGLAAVIKQRQFAELAAFDSLEAEIAGTPTPPDPALAAVFPDLGYYPGTRVEQMVRLELGPGAAYLPLIRRQGRRYRIPPLHQDLAAAMGQAYFRTATTFDNRQWMDIRGVGSGAAAIEYVERGAHQERNVLLHEYVHLFHGNVFTDAEVRRVRDLYHQAMREERVLDYYAANNEHEFLAQAYPAVLSPVKVHPLNHKSMNTAADLRRKDPATYAFVDSLMARQRAYLAGDSLALASNWAQVYVNLSERARAPRGRSTEAQLREATALLDTALVWDATYLPALLSYAALMREQRRFDAAERWLAQAEALDPRFAPVHRARAQLLGARDAGGAVDAQADLYRHALRLERDLAERAGLFRSLALLYRDHARLPDAIRAAEEYADDAPAVSTYLRDRRDEARALAAELRAFAGHSGPALDVLAGLVQQKPQNYELRAQYADALVSAGRLREAAATLADAQRILRAGGAPSAGFAARLAEISLALGDTAAARAALLPVLDGEARGGGELRLARALLALGQSTEAHRHLPELAADATPWTRAEHSYTHGWIARWRGDVEEAERRYREALAANAYHLRARADLVRLLEQAGRGAEAGPLRDPGLEMPLGPDFLRMLAGGERPAR